MALTRRALLQGAVAAGGVAAASAAAGAQAEASRFTRTPGDVGLLYDTTLCIGCRACVSRCKEVNDLPADRAVIGGGVYDAPLSLDFTTKNIIMVMAAGKETSFMKMQCMHCVDPACVSVCMAAALHKDEHGITAYDKRLCVGCRYCQVACPFDVPKFAWHTAIPAIAKCELCRHRADPAKGGVRSVANPGCAEVCPREAVVYGVISELRSIAHRRIDELPERYNPKVYGEKDGGGTNVLYLTARGISFEDLGLPQLPEEPLPDMAEHIQHSIYKGFAAPALLYGVLAWVIWKNRVRPGEGAGEEKR